MEFYERQLGAVESGGKRLRRGFTTGTAAAAAAVAAAILLQSKKAPSQVCVEPTKRGPLQIRVQEAKKIYIQGQAAAIAAVRKFAGDDIDQTAGALIQATVALGRCPDSWPQQRFSRLDEVYIGGGQGIGRVTRPGLKVAPGAAAINPFPVEQIGRGVAKVFPGQSVWVLIEAPQGEQIASKTFNPRLGIVGGISILGTTGIVEPMSEEALRDSLVEEAKVKASPYMALTFGQMGERYLVSQGVPASRICLCSNFAGFMLRQAVRLGAKEILLGGHIGKAVKLAGGIFHTHSHVADARSEILTSALALARAPHSLLTAVMNSLTAQEATDLIQAAGYGDVLQQLAEKAAQRSTEHVYQEARVHIQFYDLQGSLLAQSAGAASCVCYLAQQGELL